MSNGSTLIDVPLVGMSEVQNADNGGYSYVEAMVQTAQNEWQPIGPLVEPPVYDLSVCSTTTLSNKSNYVQSPDVLLIQDKNNIYAVNFEKIYQPASNGVTIRNPTPHTDNYYYNTIGTSLSYQTPVETNTQIVFDFSSASGPCAYLYSLKCFASFYFGAQIDKTGVTRFFYGLTFYDKYLGKKLNFQLIDFNPITIFGSYSTSTVSIPYKCFITEDINGNIGVLGYSLSGSNPLRAQEYSVPCIVEELPDKTKRVKSQSITSTQTFVANADGQIIGYDSFLSNDGLSIIDIIAINGQVSGITSIQIISRRNRVVVNQLTYTPSSFSGLGTLGGSVFISDYTNDVILSYGYTENSSTDTGVSYRMMTVNKTTGSIAFNGSEVNIINELKTTGTYFASYGIYNFRDFPSSFKPVIVFQKQLTSGSIVTSDYDTHPSSPVVIVAPQMANAIICTQPRPVSNTFFCQVSWRPRGIEFGQCYIQICNYNSIIDAVSPVPRTVFYNPSGVIGYNTTYTPSYVQSGYSKETCLMLSVASSADKTYIRSTQIGLCESFRLVQFNGDTYVFCGFNYIVSSISGLQRLGVYTTPSFTASFTGGGTITGTFSFRLAYASYGSPGPVSPVVSITTTNALTITLSIELNFLDLQNSQYVTTGLLGNQLKIYALKPSDGLFYEISNTISRSISADTTTYSVIITMTGGFVYTNLAEFETGEAPNIGLNSPRLGCSALGHIVCSDEFGEKIYTSKQVDETTFLEFSDVLFINSPPSVSRITELQEINNTLVCWSPSSIYGINGTLPDSFGNQSLSQWQVISNLSGCTNAAPTITTDKGVYFCDSSGLFRLNRGLFVDPITPYKGFVPEQTPTLSQDFWWHSSTQDGTSNVLFSTSSLRTRLTQSDFTLPYDIVDSIYVYNEDFNTFGCWTQSPSGDSIIYSVSGVYGGAVMTDESTRLLKPILGYTNDMSSPVYDTGYFCPFGQYTYGVVSSIYFKLFRVGDIPGAYPGDKLPSVSVYIRDDQEDTESHASTQTMEDPIPTSNRQTFIWRVRVTNRRCNAIRIVLNTGLWGIRGICLEVLPQPVGGVQRRLQGITQS